MVACTLSSETESAMKIAKTKLAFMTSTTAETKDGAPTCVLTIGKATDNAIPFASMTTVKKTQVTVMIC